MAPKNFRHQWCRPDVLVVRCTKKTQVRDRRGPGRAKKPQKKKKVTVYFITVGDEEHSVKASSQK
jgi:hypothetical protein